MAKNPFQGDDVDPFSGVRDKEGNVKRAGLAKSATPKKNRIVTKEELKKSGFTNLRDFLNAERGLTRRDGKPAEKGPDKATLDRVAAKQRDEDKGPDKATVDRIARKQSEEDKGPSEADLDRMAKKFDTKSERPNLFRRTMAALGGVKLPQDPGPSKEEKDDRPTTRPKPVSTAAAIQAKNMGFKSGGSVKMSSASKRADGCAKRGKTKCKMV